MGRTGEILRPSRFVGLDIAAHATAAPAEKWSRTAEVEMRRTDVASLDFDVGQAARTLPINKGIRSLGRWKRAARRADLCVLEVRRTWEINTLYTPENKLLIPATSG